METILPKQRENKTETIFASATVKPIILDYSTFELLLVVVLV